MEFDQLSKKVIGFAIDVHREAYIAGRAGSYRVSFSNDSIFNRRP